MKRREAFKNISLFLSGTLVLPTSSIFLNSCSSPDKELDWIPKYLNNDEAFLLNELSNTIIPDKYILFHAYPNPFNPITSIEYALPNDSFVSLSVYDINGRLVDQLVNTYKVLGYHKISWDAREHSTGLYFIKLVAGEYQKTQKVILVK